MIDAENEITSAFNHIYRDFFKYVYIGSKDDGHSTYG